MALAITDVLSILSVVAVIALGVILLIVLRGNPRAIADAERLTTMQNEIIERMRGEIADAKREISTLHMWVTELISQLAENGIKPVTLDDIKEAKETAVNRLLANQGNMRAIITEGFSIDEMKSLAFDIGLSTELGDTEDGASRRLIENARKAMKLRALANQIMVARPNLNV